MARYLKHLLLKKIQETQLGNPSGVSKKKKEKYLYLVRMGYKNSMNRRVPAKYDTGKYKYMSTTFK